MSALLAKLGIEDVGSGDELSELGLSGGLSDSEFELSGLGLGGGSGGGRRGRAQHSDKSSPSSDGRSSSAASEPASPLDVLAEGPQKLAAGNLSRRSLEALAQSMRAALTALQSELREKAKTHASERAALVTQTRGLREHLAASESMRAALEAELAGAHGALRAAQYSTAAEVQRLGLAQSALEVRADGALAAARAELLNMQPTPAGMAPPPLLAARLASARRAPPTTLALADLALLRAHEMAEARTATAELAARSADETAARESARADRAEQAAAAAREEAAAERGAREAVRRRGADSDAALSEARKLRDEAAAIGARADVAEVLRLTAALGAAAAGRQVALAEAAVMAVESRSGVADAARERRVASDAEGIRKLAEAEAAAQRRRADGLEIKCAAIDAQLSGTLASLERERSDRSLLLGRAVDSSERAQRALAERVEVESAKWRDAAGSELGRVTVAHARESDALVSAKDAARADAARWAERAAALEARADGLATELAQVRTDMASDLSTSRQESALARFEAERAAAALADSRAGLRREEASLALWKDKAEVLKSEFYSAQVNTADELAQLRADNSSLSQRVGALDALEAEADAAVLAAAAIPPTIGGPELPNGDGAIATGAGAAVRGVRLAREALAERRRADSLASQLVDVRENLVRANARLDAASVALRHADSPQAVLLDEIAKRDRELHSARDATRALTAELRQKESRLSSALAQQHELHADLHKLLTRRDALEQTRADLDKLLRGSGASIRNAAVNNNALRSAPRSGLPRTGTPTSGKAVGAVGGREVLPMSCRLEGTGPPDAA